MNATLGAFNWAQLWRSGTMSRITRDVEALAGEEGAHVDRGLHFVGERVLDVGLTPDDALELGSGRRHLRGGRRAA